jgi:hypothetical protein|nr:hypothetical protein [Neorhizobium tomejilense]
MDLTEDGKKKMLAQALFLMDRTDLDVAILRELAGFRSLMMSLMRVMYPGFELTPVEGDSDFLFRDPKLKGPITSRGVAQCARIHTQINLATEESARSAVVRVVIPHIASYVSDMYSQIDAIKIDGDKVRNTSLSLDIVVPLLKTLPMIDGLNESFIRQGVPDDPIYKIPHWPFVGPIRFVAAFNRPENFQFVERASMVDLGATEDTLREKALENLRSMARKIKFRTDYRKAVNEIDRLGGMASSLLLLPEFWEKEAIKARDELVVHASDYDTLLVVRKGDRQAVHSMVAAVVAGQVPSIFPPPALFVFGTNGMRMFGRADLA